MNLDRIKKIADASKVEFKSNVKKTELIKLIQVSEGNPPCYSSNVVVKCENKECCWFVDCNRELIFKAKNRIKGVK